ncbi:hypothetical protein D3C72_2377420 [compost metagenome]
MVVDESFAHDDLLNVGKGFVWAAVESAIGPPGNKSRGQALLGNVLGIELCLSTRRD